MTWAEMSTDNMIRAEMSRDKHDMGLDEQEQI